MQLRTVRWLTAGICAVAAASQLTALPAYAARDVAGGAARPMTGSAGPLLAFGENQFGQLGDGSIMNRNTPVEVNPPAGLKVTSARVASFGVGVTATGQVRAWGRGQEGELGNGATSNHSRPVLVKLPKGVHVKTVRIGFDFAVAVTTTGRALAWGLGVSGQLGNGREKSSDVPVWVDLPRGVRVTAVSADAESAIALTTTGRVLAWGDNRIGELGNGRRNARADKPVFVRIPRATRVTAVGAGVAFDFAVTAAGGLLAWGGNSSFVLGNGKPGVRRLPTRVLLPPHVKVVAAFGGLLHGLALTADGRVLAWGDNEAGQLGDGTFTNRRLPVFVHIPKNVRIATLAAGRYFSLALTRSGKVLAWGDDGSGQLGDGGKVSRDVPFQISVPGRVIAIGAGCESSASMAVVTKIVD